MKPTCIAFLGPAMIKEREMTLRLLRFAVLPFLCAAVAVTAVAQDKSKDPAPAKAPAASKPAPAAAPKKDAAPAKEAPAPSAEAAKPAADSGMSEKQKMSYAVGIQFGKAIADGASMIDLDSLHAGLKDAMEKKQLKLDDAEIGRVLQALQKQMMEAKYGSNKADGEKFLAENAKKEGVKTLPSGLQYKVLTEGTGRSPKATDTVETNYRGTFIDGKEFDSSYAHNQTAKFPVNQVIPGWTEALQLMKEGGKWELVVPYAMAYGEQGRPPQIPPFSVLKFEVELIKIVEAPAADASKPVTITPKAAPATPPPAKK